MINDSFVSAALNWWRDLRPLAWTEEQHIEQYQVNCTTDSEINLARECAEWSKNAGRVCRQSARPFDADNPRFRQAFEETLNSLKTPFKRKGGGYEGSFTQNAFETAYGTVNRLGLYEGQQTTEQKAKCSTPGCKHPDGPCISFRC